MNDDKTIEEAIIKVEDARAANQLATARLDDALTYLRGLRKQQEAQETEGDGIYRLVAISHSKGKDLPDSLLAELKVGKIANILLRDALAAGKADAKEVELMQTKEYSKHMFGIQYPLLVPGGGVYDRTRYYKEPVRIRGKEYRLCSQWYETEANNDRKDLLAWLKKHDIV